LNYRQGLVEKTQHGVGCSGGNVDDTRVWDDAHIPDDEIVLRRVPAKPDFFLQKDLVSAAARLSRAAFNFDPNGISVYRDSLMREHGIEREQIFRGRTDLRLYQLPVSAVRQAEAGVVDAIRPDDLPVGLAHALIRCKELPSVPKQRRREIQDILADAAFRAL